MSFFMKDFIEPVSTKACTRTSSMLHTTKGCVGIFILLFANNGGWKTFPLPNPPLARLNYSDNFVLHVQNLDNYNIVLYSCVILAVFVCSFWRIVLLVRTCSILLNYSGRFDGAYHLRIGLRSRSLRLEPLPTGIALLPFLSQDP